MYADIAASTAAHVEDGAPLLIAFSGGLDSTVLLHALASASRWRLQVAHVHHGLQTAAEAWAIHCARQAASLDLPFFLHRVDVASDSPDGIESAARDARYRVLERQALQTGARAIVTAHHANDQAETLLHNLVRGAGLMGLAGMPEWRPAASGTPARLRPLLRLTRAELEQIACRERLSWIEDGSNTDVRFARNYLRQSVMPRLASRWPRAAQTLAGAARRLAEAQSLLDCLADSDATALKVETGWGHAWSIEGLRALDAARQRNLLRRLIRIAGARKAPGEAWLDEWRRQLMTATPEAECPVRHAGMAGFCHRGLLWLVADRPAPAPHVVRCEDELESGIEWAGRLTFVAVPGGFAADRLRAARVELRTRQAGDRIRRGPGRHRTGVKVIAQEIGLPGWLRERAPIMVIDGEPVWMPGCEPAPPWRAAADAPGLMPVWSPAM
ncbi:tRNA lysidine(34) synthetase TilS [Methyloversatilis thermotolerans]|uniref:tRNA lysidine(34) synthetase TilS n=1 Tax=Methyloversatilis thermotolerans TaxID=1346290 RepID=UPI0003631215|nr:tRNA lysidine(34) synthetase TilS [Methyloversatilis thermotolerans]